MDNIKIAAFLIVLISALMIIFQITLALGAPFGNFAWGGKYKKLPRNLRVGSFVSSILFLIVAVFSLEKAKIINFIGSELIVSITIWIYVLVFGLSTLANLLSKSKLEKRIMTPVAFSLVVLLIVISFG